MPALPQQCCDRACRPCSIRPPWAVPGDWGPTLPPIANSPHTVCRAALRFRGSVVHRWLLRWGPGGLAPCALPLPLPLPASLQPRACCLCGVAPHGRCHRPVPLAWCRTPDAGPARCLRRLQRPSALRGALRCRLRRPASMPTLWDLRPPCALRPATCTARRHMGPSLPCTCYAWLWLACARGKPGFADARTSRMPPYVPHVPSLPTSGTRHQDPRSQDKAHSGQDHPDSRGWCLPWMHLHAPTREACGSGQSCFSLRYLPRASDSLARQGSFR